MTLDITVTDLFCGAGGSSIGAEASGAVLKMAANHWRLAIETHNANFPHADHDCADVSQVNPRRYPTTDILIASPECTNHSSAKTRKPVSTLWDPTADAQEERSRATMWDVPRFAEHHRYSIVVVENVVEARRWAPYDSWLGAMHALGYDHRAVYMNSAIAQPTPQSRDRMYVVFWRRGNPAPDLDFRPIAWCPSCERDVEAIQSWKQPNRPFGKFRAQYVYRCPGCAGLAMPYAWPAASAIDWALPAPRIGDRDRPLAPATIRRIQAGLDRYGPAAIIQAAGHTYERPGYFRTWSVDQPLGTQTTTIQHGLVVDTAYAHASDAQKVRPTDEPGRTQTGQQTQALVVPLRTHGQARPVVAPLPTIVAGNVGAGLVVPMQEHGKAYPAEDGPLPTMVATSAVHAIVTLRGTRGRALERSVAPASDPLGTVSAGGGHHALLSRPEAFVTAHYTARGNPAQMSHPVEDPLGSVTAVDHHSLTTVPFLTRYMGAGVAAPVTDPHRTVDTRDRYGLVEPSVEVEDCGFRMLEPHEIGRAMAFPDTYEVRGNKRDRVRQYGNAVTPPVMSLILGRAIASLAGGRVA